jgi:hypothetical protein
MRRQIGAMLVGVVLVLVAGAGVLQAQSATVDIGFPFTAGGKSFPAGTYRIDGSPDGPVVLRATKPPGEIVSMMVITFLGRHDNDTFPELVFDKTASGLYLSEVWMPGLDGWLVLSTKERHQHQVLQSKPAK